MIGAVRSAAIIVARIRLALANIVALSPWSGAIALCLLTKTASLHLGPRKHSRAAALGALASLVVCSLESLAASATGGASGFSPLAALRRFCPPATRFRFLERWNFAKTLDLLMRQLNISEKERNLPH